MRSPKSKLQLWNKLFISTVFSRNDKRLSNLQLQVGDEGLEPTRVSHSKQRVLRVTGIPAGPNLSLGELTCRLIERWDELDDAVKTEIADILSHH